MYIEEEMNQSINKIDTMIEELAEREEMKVSA